MAVVVSDSNFESEVLKQEGVVLVDFWAEWCGPCKIMLPLIEELSNELEGKAKICKIDVDSNPQTAAGFRIMSIPTLMIFKDGNPVSSLIGVQEKDNIVAELQKFM